MNKNDFIKLVNLLIDKKLKELLPGMIENEIKKHLQSGIQPTDADFDADDDLKNLIPNTNYKNPILRDDSVKRGLRTESKEWTKNPVINKILNDTAQDFKPLPKDPTDTLAVGSYQQMLSEEYENIGEEFSFNTKNMSNIINRQPSGASNSSVNNLKNELLQQTNANPEIVNAMVKDYSKVLKAIDKKAKSKRGNTLPLGNGIGESW